MELELPTTEKWLSPTGLLLRGFCLPRGDEMANPEVVRRGASSVRMCGEPKRDWQTRKTLEKGGGREEEGEKGYESSDLVLQYDAPSIHGWTRPPAHPSLISREHTTPSKHYPGDTRTRLWDLQN